MEVRPANIRNRHDEVPTAAIVVVLAFNLFIPNEWSAASSRSTPENCLMSPHGITIEGSRFWVTHRRREYGPFDYEWSREYDSVELLYQGQKFGELCGRDEIFADLKSFSLPQRVVEVAVITLGAIVYGVLCGLDEAHKRWAIYDHLTRRGLDHFAKQIRRAS
jgi:hypothetical protein